MSDADKFMLTEAELQNKEIRFERVIEILNRKKRDIRVTAWKTNGDYLRFILQVGLRRALFLRLTRGHGNFQLDVEPAFCATDHKTGWMTRQEAAQELEKHWAPRSQRLAERVSTAVNIAIQYGGFDGADHKDWVIDQMVRALLSAEAYTALRDLVPDWDEGVAP